MTSSTRPPSAQRRDAAREKARALREAEQRRRRRTRTAVASAVIVLVLVIVAVVAALTTRSGSGTSPTGAGSRPPGVSAAGGVVTGPASAPHTVTIYEDYQCPNCRAFEASANTWLEQQRDAGALRLEFRPIAFLDRSSSGNEYSTRAANAAACVAGDPAVDFAAWNDAMYAQQPEEGGHGRTDAQLVAVARAHGAGASVARCITGHRYDGWAARVTRAALSAKGGVSGTPTVLVDGVRVGQAGYVPTLAQVQSALSAAGR